MRKSFFVAGALTAFLLTSAVSSGTVSANTCENLLDNNIYRCQVKVEFGGQFEDCFRFSSPGLFSIHFDLLIDGFGSLACQCKAKEENFREPKFNKSKEFHCVSVPETSFFNLAVEGKASNDRIKIKDGQVVNSFGDSFVYECVLDPECALNGVATQSTGSPWNP